MGNQLVGIAPSQIFPVEHYFTDHLSDFHFDINLGSTRFFKVARARSQEGLIVVKMFVIHDPSLPLSTHKCRIEQIRNSLASAVNCLPFQQAILTDKAGFILREYVKDSLYDRISTRPFLLSIEKKWIAFQILYALYQCHKVGVCHGDIKMENIVVTSWLWVLLTDFASFKPTCLPEDNPADFSYFFDTSRRRTCYIAPERFVRSFGTDSGSQLLLTDETLRKEDLSYGMDIFSAGCVLGELFAEGQPPFDFSQLLAYRAGEYSLEMYLSKLEDINVKILVESMISRDPSARLTAEIYLAKCRGQLFPEYFYTFLHSYMLMFSAASPILSPDEKIERLKKDVHNIINLLSSGEVKWTGVQKTTCDVLVIITSLVTSCIRGLHFSNSKIQSLQILRELSMHTSTEILLDRILPYIIYLIQDPYPRVRVCAVQTLTKILSFVKTVPLSDANVFPEYILPGLAHVSVDDALIVRTAFAENIAELAEHAVRLLEYCQVNQGDTPRDSYESELSTLHQMMQQMVSSLLTDQQNIVKQTLIENGITKLCVFFGKQKANDILLSHMITFLNDKEDKQLRGSFFDCIVGVAAYIGVHASPILTPLLQQGLTDSEEFVVRKTLNAITALTELSLLHKPDLYQLLDEATTLLVHPNLWIRQAAVGFLSAVARTLNVVEVQCKVSLTFIKYQVLQLEKEVLVLNALKPAIPRAVYDSVIKCSELQLLLQLLEERNNARTGMKNVVATSFSITPQQTNILRNLFHRLGSDGMTEEVEESVLLMAKHLIKVNRYITLDFKVDEVLNGKIELFSKSSSINFHSVRLLKNEDIKQEIFVSAGRRNEDCSQNMNEEWKTMFGSSDEPNISAKQEKPVGPTTTNWDMKGSSGQSIMDHSLQEKSYIQYRCAPCRLELRKLIKHRERLQGFRDTWNDIRKTCAPSGWKLRPGLVSYLHAHSGPVTRLVAIPETTLMASSSHDGCIRIWDCGKMEGRNIANRAKQVYNARAGPLIGMTLCSNNRSLGIASQSGSVAVLKIEANSNKMSVYDCRQLDLDEEGPPVDITSCDSGSVLVYASIFGCIIGWDLRAPGTAWKLENDLKQGVITAMHMDCSQCFLTVGTSSGWHTTWDLRFHLPITSFVHPRGSRVRRLCGHPKELSWLISSVVGNNEVSLWCIESASRQTVLWGSNTPPFSNSQNNDSSIFGLCPGIVDNTSFLLTGGSDHRIRYWNLDNLTHSYMAIPAGSDMPNGLQYSYRSRLIDGTNVVQELQSESRSKPVQGNEESSPDAPSIGHHNTITDISLVSSTAGSLLASGASDGIIKVWK